MTKNLGIKACGRKSETGLVAFQSEERPANWRTTRQVTTMVKARWNDVAREFHAEEWAQGGLVDPPRIGFYG